MILNEQEIIKYNERCAKFLGAYFCNDDQNAYPNGYWIIDNDEIDLPSDLKDMSFHSDWNWIHKIIDNIEKLELDKFGLGRFITTCSNRVGHYFEIRERNSYDDKIEDGFGESKKEAVVQAINQFLIWYEQNK